MNLPAGNTEVLHTEDEIFLQDLFDIQRAKTPDAIAVYFEGKKLRYSELGQKADALANEILGLVPNALNVCSYPAMRLKKPVTG
jgi:non-ribosomal peptide synthetase component E (peptide arylation enzyme)